MALLGASVHDEGRLNEQQAGELICEMGRRLWQKEMVEGNGGNLSCRLADGRVLATPTSISKGFMEPDDLVVLDLEGNQLGGRRRITSEILMHLAIYRERPGMNAVAHAHPRHATAFALTGQVLPAGVLPEVELFAGEIGLAPYHTPGSVEFAEALVPYIKRHEVILLANHGAVAMGRGLIEAYWKLEILESACATCLIARQLGVISTLPPEEIEKIRRMRSQFTGE